MATLADIRAKYPQYGDMSDDDFAQKFHAKYYNDMPFDQFAQKIGYSKAPAQEKPQGEMSLGRQLLGNLELGGAAVANIPHGLLHAGSDIINRVTGNYDAGDPDWIKATEVPVGAAGKELSGALSTSLENTLGDAPTSAVGAVHEATNDPLEHPVGTFIGKVGAPIAGDVAALAGARAPIQAGVSRAAGAVREAFAAPPEYPGGFRSGANQPVARTVAGQSGQQALQIHNQQVGDTVAAGEANHPAGVPMSYESLDKATQAPNSVYTRVAAGLPEGPVDEVAQSAIDAAGSGGKLVTTSEAAQNQIASMKAQLKGSMTGQQLVDNMRSLRQEGFKRAANSDVDQQAIGQAQLDLANALEEHVARNLPARGDVTLADFQAARKTLAKNYAVQGALHGPNVDMQAIARIQRANPQLLDGGLKDIADFANGPGRNTTSLPNTYNQPSLAGDIAESVNLEHPVQGVARFLGGRRARDSLTGNTQAAIQAATARYGAQPGRFNPRPALTPPPGTLNRTPTQLDLGNMSQGPGPAPFTLEEGANPNPPNGGGRPGDIPLADVLSHGVEQSPPAGLSVGPMGAPKPTGIPFRVNAEHAAGGLSLADELGARAPETNGDLAVVKAEGVPEGTAARTGPAPKVTHEADEDTGAHTVTSENGETHGQESGPYLLVKRTDTAKGAQGNGEGTARMETMLQQAEARGLKLGSDVSVSPAQVKVYQRLERMGYTVTKNPFTKNPATGNLVSADPRKPVFEVSSPLSLALGQ